MIKIWLKTVKDYNQLDSRGKVVLPVWFNQGYSYKFSPIWDQGYFLHRY